VTFPIRRAAVGTAATLVVLQTLGCGGSGATTQATQSVDIGALQADVPADWSIQRLPGECRRIGPGALITNLNGHEFERDDDHLPPDSCTNVWDLVEAPDDFVLVDISEFFFHVPRAGGSPGPDSAFPPQLVADPYRSSTTTEPLCSCDYRHGAVFVGEIDFIIRVWVGEAASQVDREAVDALVGSVRPRQA
jgi:hypothetical protein